MHGTRGVSHEDGQIIASSVAVALREVNLGRRPSPPVMGKWTKQGPAVDFFYIGITTKVLPTIYTKSFKRVTTAMPASSIAAPWLMSRDCSGIDCKVFA